MARYKRNKEKLGYFIQKFSRYSAIALLSVILLSESVRARETLAQLQIAQQLTKNQLGETGVEAERLTEEGFKLFQQGSKQSLLAAREKWQAALVLWRKLGDKEGQAFVLLSIGRVYGDLGEKQKALEFFNQALPLSRAVDQKRGEATILNNIGRVYDDLGEKQKALEFFNQALPLSRAVGDRGGEANILNNIGQIYNDLGEKQKALEYHNQALPLCRAVGDRAGEATTLNNAGIVYSALGEKQKALEYYKQALPLYRAVSNRSGEATILNNIGRVYSALGENQKALEYYKQALPLYRAVSNRSGEATILNNIGISYDDLGEKQKAMEFFNQALPLYRAVRNRGDEAVTLVNLAYMERQQGNKIASLKQVNAAIKIIEELRTTYTNKDLQSSYFASVQDYYQFKTTLLMELHKKNPSFGYDVLALNNNEASRARALVELLAEANANIRKGVDPKLLAKEQLLLGKIDALQNQIQSSSKSNNEARIAALKQENENLLKQYGELKTQIRTSSPQYAAIKYPQPLELKQIQQQLDKDTVLLQYSLGQDRSFVWAITPDSMNAYELPKEKQIEDAANKFLEVIKSSNTPYGKDNPDAINKPASQLSQIILAPATEKLGKKRLVIVAGGVLQSIVLRIYVRTFVKCSKNLSLLPNLT